jgi:excisionase family DNA binding protein
MEKLYSTKEITEKLGISIHILRNWIKEGRGPACFWTPGRHRRYREEDVINWYQTKYVTSREG